MSSSAHPLRRSTRLQETPPSPNDDHRDDDDVFEPPAKRRRKSAPSRNALPKVGGKGKKKSLSMLIDMPLDILFEIFSHMHPYDLLHLARTTKALRTLLMSRSSVTIWRLARANVPDLPDCPPDLVEPAYANLLFDPHCHFCIKARVMTAMWVNRVRCCKACMKDNFLKPRDVHDLLEGDPAKFRRVSMLPAEVVNNKVLIAKAALDELNERIDAYNDDREALQEFERERTQASQKQEKSGELLEKWHTTQTYKRNVGMNELRSRRRSQILARLQALGYDDDLRDMSADLDAQFSEHPFVKQAKELTDRIWNNIKEPMIQFAEEARAQRIMQESCMDYCNRLELIRTLVAHYLADRPLSENLPSLADFSWYTPVRTIMFEARGLKFHLDMDLTSVVAHWRMDMARAVCELIDPAYKNDSRQPEDKCEGGSADGAENNICGSQDKDKIVDKGKGKAAGTPSSHESDIESTRFYNEEALPLLYRATTWFRCTQNGCLLDYPRVLAHRCAKMGPPIKIQPETAADDLNNAYNLVFQEFPWNWGGDQVVYDLDAQRAAEKVVRACGLDPEEVQKTDMNINQDRFVCGQCSDDAALCVMPWRVAVEHLCQPDHEDAKLTVLNVRDQEYVLEVEPAKTERQSADCWKLWGCIHCRSHVMTLWDIVDHCIVEHRIQSPHQHNDFARHIDAVASPGDPAWEVWLSKRHFTTPILR